MIVFFVILVVLILYFLLKRRWKKQVKTTTALSSASGTSSILWEKDELGRLFRLVPMSRDVARRTYIKGIFKGKYWGEMNESYSNQFQNGTFYDFNIYDAHLTQTTYSPNPFEVSIDLTIPKDRLPHLLKTTLEINDSTYDVNLLEPVFSEIKMDRKLHQTEGKEAFGTFSATVTGYLLDTVKEDYYEIIYKDPSGTTPGATKQVNEEPYKTLIPTGRTEVKGNYERTEYFESDFVKTYWGDWEKVYKKPPSENGGCLDSCSSIFGILFLVLFLFLLLPNFGFLIPFALLLFVLFAIPSQIWEWIFKGIAALLGIFLIIALLQKIFDPAPSIVVTEPVVENTLPEESEDIEEILEENQESLISHTWNWQDYDENLYQGTFFIKREDYINAVAYKASLPINLTNERDYDRIIHLLKENDKEKLLGIYDMFDSIRSSNNISRIKFPELIVSFVQSIPYALILTTDCNPNLYDDSFVSEYLSSENAICQGNQRYGINSPVEFMSHLRGDCDTRTLLLYTILSHYDYDVVLLSSEYYAHSIIGINLPLNGITYNYRNQRYVVWETTAPNIKPGLLSNQFSNLNHWRISLKSQ